MLGDGVSQLASNLFRFGSKKRGVCICNAQCRLQGLGEGPLGPTIRTHHGSLDRLLQQQQQQQQLKQKTIGEEPNLESSPVDKVNVSTESLEASHESGKRNSMEGEDRRLPPRPPPRCTTLPSKSAWRVKEEFDRGVEVEKFYHQINGDIFEITRRVRARNEDTIEQKCIRRKGSVRLAPEPPPRTILSSYRAQNSPQLAPRRQKSAEEVPLMQREAARAQDELEWFDRRAQQRHSARSAESGAVREETIEWLQRQRGPPRVSSGPSEMTVLKDEVPEWLLEHLPRKHSKPMLERPLQNVAQPVKQPSPPTQIEAGRTSATSYAKAFKEELAELLKKPLSRQSSGPGEFSLLKTDIIDWLKQLQGAKALPREEADGQPSGKSRRHHHRRNGSGGETPRSQSQDETSQQEVTRKRHSLGHSEHQMEATVTDWIAYPLSRLSNLNKTSNTSTTERPPLPQTQPVPNCCERRHHHERSRERKLRHSASEVVNGGQPIYAKPHKERYQYVPKDINLELLTTPAKEPITQPTISSSLSRETKRERSRRHQTQRSATVSDMSGHLSNNQKRKSSSAERAPRSPSPCTDPNCPLLPICTDPHCRYLECPTAANNRLSSSLSTANIIAKAQVHSIPAYATSDNTLMSPPLPQSAPPILTNTQTRRRLVICHECRSCAPLLTCKNRKCLNATKCNSLPRCAADFNRLRTTLAQEPPTLHDIQPSSIEYMGMELMEDTSPYMLRRTYANGGMQFRSNSQPNTLEREDLTTSLWQIASEVTDPAANRNLSMLTTVQSTQIKTLNGNGNGGGGVNGSSINSSNKLLKSASAASLNSRRRRHKTVHFGENLLREVCQNRKLIKTEQIPSGSAPMKANIQMLYNFVEGVLSAWVDDDEDQVRSGAESEPEHGALELKPIHRCNRLRYQCIKRIVEEAAQLTGTLKLGNSRYRHRHWRSTAKQCNEMFLRKVKRNFSLSVWL